MQYNIGIFSIGVFFCIGFLASFLLIFIASGNVFVFFCRMQLVFFPTVFGISRSFSFISLSRNFLSVIEVINFQISFSVMKSENSQSSFISVSFSQWFSSVSVSECLSQNKSSREFQFSAYIYNMDGKSSNQTCKIRFVFCVDLLIGNVRLLTLVGNVATSKNFSHQVLEFWP